MLSASRSSGANGPNPISIESIFTLADHLHLNRDDSLFFLQALDQTYLEEVAKKWEAERKRSQPKKR